jgi:hypothetical protein
MNLRRTIFVKKIKTKKLILEMIIHFIQPYPYLDQHWDMLIVGVNVTYSLSSILFSFCILRLYVCVKVFKNWNFYTDDKSKRIFVFFKNQFLHLFLYKANIKARGAYTIILLLVVFVYLLALIFKIYEDYIPSNTLGFSYIWNCLWLLIETITTSILIK